MFSVSRASSMAAVGGSRRILHTSCKKLKASITDSVTTQQQLKQHVTHQATSTPTAAAALTKGSGESFAKRNPFAFQLGVATAKTMAADLLTQVVAEGKSLTEVDWQRNGIFVVFGFGYLGCFQYWLMVTKYRQWFPTMDRFAKLSMAGKLKDTAGILDAAKMVLFDVIVHLPMIYFPCYYTIKELVVGTSWNPVHWVTDGVTKYSNNIQEDLTAMIKLWGPSDCIQFVLPIHIRMPFRHMVSFFWTAYVSFTRGATTTTTPTTTNGGVGFPETADTTTAAAAAAAVPSVVNKI